MPRPLLFVLIILAAIAFAYVASKNGIAFPLG
jgi:hypothetical protein